MANKLYYPPSANAIQKTLDAQLDQGTTGSMTLNNVTSIQNKPGIVLINRIDSNGEEQPAADREWVAFEGTSGSTLTTLTRGLAGSSDQDHAVGSIVEFIYDVTQHQEVIDVLAQIVDETDTTKLDIQGAELILDADGDSSITADTDDQLDIKLAGADKFKFTTTDIDLLGTNPNVLVGGANPWRTVSIFGGLKPTTTSGCGAKETVEAGTNDIDYEVLPFDASSDENAFVNFQMPDSYDGGTIQFRYVWTNAGGGSAETVVFELSGRAFADDDAIDQAVGTPVEVSDTWIAQNDIHISAWSSDVTLAGSPAGGQWVHFEIMRDVSEDDLTGDARLMDVQIRYKQAQYSD